MSKKPSRDRHEAKCSLITTAVIAPKNSSILSKSHFINREQTTNRTGQTDLDSLFLIFSSSRKIYSSKSSLDLIFHTVDLLNGIVARYLG